MTHLKFALRTLFKTPFVTAVAIISLALGIGANAAIFSIFDDVLLRPLPVPQPNQLVNLAAPGPKPESQTCGNPGNCDSVFSYPMFRDLEKVQTVFTGIAAHFPFGANLAYKGQTISGEGVMVSGSYFPVLGVQPALGRLLGAADDRTPGESPVVVLSHAYWQSRFASDPGVLQQPMIVNGRTLTIVGVAPRGFEGTTMGTEPQVFVPITLCEWMSPGFKDFENRRSYWPYLFARLKPRVSIEQARASLGVQYHNIINDVEAPLQNGMSEKTLARFRGKPITLEPGPKGQSSMIGEARVPLLLLFGVTAFVLAIACANVANLLLARSAARAGEMAVRLSLGASRRQLIGQLLLESCLLAVMGGVAGLLVARWTLDLFASLLPTDMGRSMDTTVDATVVMFAGALAIGTGLLFGLFPALHSTRPDPVSALKGTAGQPSGARAAARFRSSLATAQIALSMALLVLAGLFTKSLINVSRVELGVKIDNVITFGVSPELNGYTPVRSKQLFVNMEEQLTALPGVNGVTASVIPLLGGDNWGNSVAVEGFKEGPDVSNNSSFNEVGPGYFRTLGIPLVSGREFTIADADRAPKVAIVNEAFAKKFNLGRQAVGKRMSNSHAPDAKLDYEIVGLATDAKYNDVKNEVPPVFFFPYRQDEKLGSMTFYVRTSLDPNLFLANIPKVVAKLDPNLPVEGLRTMPQQVRENVFLDRMISVLSAGFSLLATLLAAVGLYGVLAYTVSQRTREIGLRMALGATPARVRHMIMNQVMLMMVIGGVVGLSAAVAVGHFAESLLYRLKGYDTMVLGASAIALTLVALGAGFIPALRASQVEPMTTLRYE